MDLPSVGTNFQDGASAIQLFNISPNANLSDLHTTNEPGTGASALVNITQILGEDGAKEAIAKLKISVSQRASALISSGAFTSQKGLEKILRYQAESIGDLNGTTALLLGVIHDRRDNR